MDGSTLTAFKEWFGRYCAMFYSSDENDQRNILLKEQHTRNVCSNMVAIVAEEGGQQAAATAEAIALFHDVGRFEQYRRYQTFRDSESVDHALLGVEVLTEHGVLDTLDPAERMTICQAVRLHNVFTVPAQLSPDVVPFVRFIRDADKLDIWRVFIELFDTPPEHRSSAATLGLPDTGSYNPELLKTLHDRKMISLARLRSVDDFKLLQLSWIFDLNTRTALRLTRERDYIRRLAATLPMDGEIDRAVTMLEQYVTRVVDDGMGMHASA